MKGIDWGALYDAYHETIYDVKELEKQISVLMADEDITCKKGVYEYVLSKGKNERVLSVRAFSDKDKRTKYEQQGHICPICGKEHPFENMHGDHIVEWSKGGKTVLENLQMVCHECHKELTRTIFD
jgi:5-methylcytosine-specific restriction endonuclease McrA